MIMNCEADCCFKFIFDPNDFSERYDSHLMPCYLRALKGEEMGWRLISIFISYHFAGVKYYSKNPTTASY